MTKAYLISRAKEILDNLKPNEKVTNQKDIEFLLEFFYHHPNIETKLEGGFDYFFKVKNTDWMKHFYCFAIMRKDKTYQTISVNFKNTNTNKYIVNQALRNCIEHLIIDKKNSVKYGIDRCEVTNEILYESHTHIDHYSHDFKDVVTMFLSKYKLSHDSIAHEVKWNRSKPCLHNTLLENLFIEFHNENTNLRAVTSHYNLTRKKA